MNVLARVNGRNGEITIIEERATGARVYHEAGVDQSYVLPGGWAALPYVRLMKALLAPGRDALLFGCGGGTLATELHKLGRRVIVVDDNSVSFELAHRYFWMPKGITCVLDDMTSYLVRCPDQSAAIGVDIGGPCFDYDATLNNQTCALLARALTRSGVIALNIPCDWSGDETPEKIAERLRSEDLDVWTCFDPSTDGGNVIIVASDGGMNEQRLKRIAVPLRFRTRNSGC